MKKLKRRPMNKLLFVTALFSMNLYASEPGVALFGRVVDLRGEGFISYHGKTREIRKGDGIEQGAEIVIEHHGQVSFTDNADHRFHLGNSSSASVNGNTVELRSGDLWFQSLNKNEDYKIKTANALVSYQGGEAILTYESGNGKSQLMVINGMMKLANLLSQDLNLSVGEGHFSFVDSAYEEGAPRDPTPVGEKTYTQLVGLFRGITPMDKNSVAVFKEHGTEKNERKIASVVEEKKIEIKDKLIEDYKESLLNSTTKAHKPHDKNESPKNKKVLKASTSVKQIIVHIYGQKKVETKTALITTEAASKSRAPASILEQEVPSDKVQTPNPYSKDYKKEYKESDKLIEELKKL
jgi:hypothetical protein